MKAPAVFYGSRPVPDDTRNASESASTLQCGFLVTGFKKLMVLNGKLGLSWTNGLNAVGGPDSESYGAICPCSIPPVAYICSKVAHTDAYMVIL